jgi:hypothetical protein
MGSSSSSPQNEQKQIPTNARIERSLLGSGISQKRIMATTSPTPDLVLDVDAGPPPLAPGLQPGLC